MNKCSWLARFALDAYAFQRPWRDFLGQLGTGQREDVQGVIRRWSQLRAYSGVIGGMYYDLAKPNFSREPSLSKLEVQLVTGAVITATSKADDVIDEQELSLDERVATVQQLFTTLRAGTPREWKSPVTAAVSLLLLYIHQKISATPHREVFFDEFGRMKNAALKQITGNVSIGQAMELGSAYAGTIMAIPYCWDSGLPERFIIAARHFGAYGQIFDDIADSKHDRAQGVQTAITLAESKASVAEARIIAMHQYKASLAQLEPGERGVNEALKVLMMVERLHQNWFGHRAREIKDISRAN